MMEGEVEVLEIDTLRPGEPTEPAKAAPPNR
jgi:hypothetical protein